jgi:ketosteroid isomerase-like protein
MRRFLLAAALAVGCAFPAAAADADETAILAQIERFFGAMRAQDAPAIKAILLEDTTFSAQRFGPEGVKLARIQGQAFAERVAGQKGLDERMWDPVVMRRGPIAMVWAPYEFRLDGKTTHCGVDVFDMVKVDGTWRIAHLMWTQEPDACPELKAKPKGR